MHTNEATCIINGLKIDVLLINQEPVSKPLTSQFDSVEVKINSVINY